MLKKMLLSLVNFRRWAASMSSRTVSALAHMITTAKQERRECYLSFLINATWLTFIMLSNVGLLTKIIMKNNTVTKLLF